MQRGDVVVGGFLGGAVPYLLGMAHDALVGSAQGESHLYASTGYWVGTLLFGVIGAVVAYYLEQGDRKKAFAMGAAAPGIVLGLMQGAHTNGSALPAQSQPTALSWFVPSAFAAPAPVHVQQGDMLMVTLTGVGPALARYGSVGLLIANAGQDLTAAKYTAFGRDSTIAVDHGRSLRAYVLVGGVTSEPVDLSKATSIAVTLTVSVRNQSFLSGLAKTLGIRSVRQWKPVVEMSGGGS